MALEVKLNVFEGPLDLLLHLIDKNRIDIYDIPISEVTEQYLDYIRQMEREDMEVTSEFLVMAATLIDIKCRMLLPKTVNEDGEEEDPRAELVEKLLEYKMARIMADQLRDRMSDGEAMLCRKKNVPEEVEQYEEPVDYRTLIGKNDLNRLNTVFQELLRRQDYRIDRVRAGFGRIEKEAVDMDEKTVYVKAYVRAHEVFSFRALLEEADSKAELIVTFLVVLEEMKLGEIEIEQDDLFGDIMIRSLVCGEDDSSTGGAETDDEQEYDGE